ncbi:Ig-like domain-containing protein [Nonomuraea angiospora]|uniref:Lipoprotein-anchoring transpeptidase ErfK/SrfK n=1 Tax=Nonomuraea angiospora TaxID=46172 RepID=A0ABR9M515_9ACTN|nr:Ig-like domain-containing protein [Nonomuraea angiospora]MBE1588004.1 lipoprotein-anchoring transpeptidase ErfK/SrfK [Nonomuraea angiospora]
MRRAVLTCVAFLLLACGCSSAPARAPSAPPVVRVWPAFDTKRARTDRGLVVRARGGTLSQVLVSEGGEQVPGRLDGSHTTWRSAWTLKPAAEYSVAVTATGALGPATVAVGRFHTRPAVRTFQVAATAPLPGETVGAGMPVIIDFDAPVEDKAAVERALEVQAETPVEGAWRWTSDTQVIYRTRRFWPPHQQVTVTAHLAGVRAGGGVYGATDSTFAFTVGRRQTSTIDTRTHQMVVRRDGEIAQRMAISAGMATTPEYTTTSGIHLTMDKGNPVRMISPGRVKGDPGYYDMLIDHAVRISNSGEYVHAKDNVWAQGRANVSHGCINARPDQAAWFYDTSLRGDPVTIVGTDRELGWDNGWGFWQLPWEKWREGSALVQAGPAAARVPPG